MAENNLCIALNQVAKTVDTPEGKLDILDNISLEVEYQEAVVIKGASGSGKTTLLGLMAGLDQASSGDILLLGHNLTHKNEEQRAAIRAGQVGFVFQSFHLLVGYSALDNVADGLLYTGLALDERRELARSALETVGLAHRLGHVTTQLSGGESQRVAIARAILGGPSIILADEPTGNLDSKTSAGIVELLHDLNREGSTIVVVTHNPEVASAMPREIQLRDGLIASDQSTQLIG